MIGSLSGGLCTTSASASSIIISSNGKLIYLINAVEYVSSIVKDNH